MSKNKQSSQNLQQSKSLHLDSNWLRTKYESEGLSTYQIAKIVNRNPKGVYQKLKDFGIQTRSRAETLAKNSWWKIGMVRRTGWKHTEETKAKLRKKAIGRKGLVGELNPMFGKRSPNWKGGTTQERQATYGTREWKSLVKYIYARDSYTCQRCKEGHNKSNKLHAHHIQGWADNPSLRREPKNLVTLCNHCHAWIHSKKNTKMEFIEGPTYRVTCKGSLKVNE